MVVVMTGTPDDMLIGDERMTYPARASEAITALDSLLNMQDNMQVAHIVVDHDAKGFELITSCRGGGPKEHSDRYKLLSQLMRAGGRVVGFLVSMKLAEDTYTFKTLPLKPHWAGDPQIEERLNRARDQAVAQLEKTGNCKVLPRA